MSSDKPDKLLSNLVGTVRAASALSAQDLDFFKSLDSDISKSVEGSSSKLLNLINEVLLSIDENNDTIEYGKDNFQESWKDIGDIMDNLFEKSDHAFDALKRNSINQGNSNVQYLDDSSRSNLNPSKRIEKPQLNFKTPIDNTESHPFKPLLENKPHALRPLSEILKQTPETENIPSHYPHPYEYEIDTQEYNESILQIRDPIPSQPWEDTDPVWVDTKESLQKLLNDLRSAKEIAVDLEHHDYRSYYGIVCLMQISTRERDWLVDTIALREELHVLNEIFTDPSVLKVFHGAFMDIIWLQRDLGIYVVSLFDTYHASRSLGLPRHSLAYLLEKFAQFKTSKKYQLADWRIRPLTKPMRAYARADTHFLLNIYDQLRNSLIEQNKLAAVLHDSRNVAKRRFEYTSFRPKIVSANVFSPIEKDEPWRNLMYQYNIPLSREPLMRKLYEWRDTIARRDDESPRYVMPNQLLVSLVAIAPTDPAGVLSVSNFITDHVRSNSKMLSKLIKKTLESLKNGDVSTNNTGSSQLEEKDLSQVLSISQIQNMCLQFNSLASKVKKANSATDSMPKVSILFDGDHIFSNDRAVLYSENSKIVIDENQLQERKLEVSEKLKEVQEPDFRLHVNVTTKETDEVSKDVSEKEDVNRASETDPLETNKDEIIVLKKKKRHEPQDRKKIGNSTDVEPMDYKNAEKLLGNGKKSSKQKTTKRKFDPYTSENVGPQSAKKRRKPTPGKNMSFKN